MSSFQSHMRGMVVGRAMLWIGAWLSLMAVMVGSEVFTSTADLHTVLSMEREVVTLLDTYIRDVEEKLQRMRSYIDDFEKVKPEVSRDERAIENPLHAYQLMKRLAVDWAGIEQMMQTNRWQELLHQIYNRRNGLSMPHDEDLQGAAMALVRLQETYRLNASDLARGDVQGIKSAVGLSARDCLYLGKHSYHLGFLDLAIEWYEEAMRVADLEGNTTAGQAEIIQFLEQAIQLHDETIESGVNRYHTFPEPIRGKAPAELKKVLIERTQYRLGSSLTYEDDEKNYRALCRGEKLMDPVLEAKLYCEYSTRGDPYFILHPIKVERNSFSPEIYTFHNVISDTEIEKIKMSSRPLLARSTVLSLDGAGREVSNVRTSKNAWLGDHDDTWVEPLMRRVGWMTGLNIFEEHNAEPLQVANYGIGGHYNPHHDYLFKDKSPEQLSKVSDRELANGDRIATFMFYLSDVARGGATVFPRVGAAVWPVKGSAAFWFNLHQNGEKDILTLHGACPVLHGAKWVGNKWIRELNQVFKRPCAINPEE